MKKILLLLLSISVLLILSACDNISSEVKKYTHQNQTVENKSLPKQQPLKYEKKKLLKFDNLDEIGRPTNAHIQLTYNQKPKKERSERLEYNPPGWHNYRTTYQKPNGQISKYWTFDRSHMIGYLFSGVNDEPKNLFTGTVHLNRGAYAGMNTHDEKSMLYYEMKLNNWLKTHPNHKLDYQVTPIYQKDELVPREVRLSYSGYTPNGKSEKINVGSSLETKGNHATIVTLPNEEPNLKIDYKTGRASKVNN